MTPEIQTERLELVAFSPEQYLQLEHDRADANIWSQLGVENPYRHLIDQPGPLLHRFSRVRANPEFAPFALRLAVRRTDRVVVGSAGFHDLPDARGMIEIGLEIVPGEQRQGYARELLHGMWGWAITDPRVTVLRYACGVENAPSQALVASLGFAHVDVQIDEEDGPEDVYELSVAEYRERYC